MLVYLFLFRLAAIKVLNSYESMKVQHRLLASSSLHAKVTNIRGNAKLKRSFIRL